MQNTQPTIYLKNYQPSAYVATTVFLDINIHPTQTQIKSKIQVVPNGEDSNAPLTLHGEDITLQEVKINGEIVPLEECEVTDKNLTIADVPNTEFTLEITNLCNPEENKQLSGLYLSGDIYCTQCEAEGFRRITYYFDRPDILAKFTVRLEGDKQTMPLMLSNGNLVNSGDLEEGRHFAQWVDPFPKPAYLFAMVAGDMACVEDSFKTMSGKSVALKFYTEHGLEDRVDWAMESLKASMKWDEDRYGLEYDLDIFMVVAVKDFNSGAMENKGLNIFNDAVALARPDTATDMNYIFIEKVIGHEYFHNWTGDRVTCRDWFQLCLKEGLTVFRDQEFTGDLRDHTVHRIESVQDLRGRQFSEDAGPLAHPVRPENFVEIRNFYTATVYDKGAELCRMIQTMVGVNGFRKGMDLYFKRHDGTAAIVENFVSAMADANSIDLTQFHLWYSQAGTPDVTCKLKYSASNSTATLTLTQSLRPTPENANKQPMHMPFKLGFLDSNGKDMPLELKDGTKITNGVLELHETTQTFEFVNIPEAPTPSYLRDFSAPVNLSTQQTTQELEFLMEHDSNLFNRWQAGYSYAMQIILAALNGQPLRATAFAQAAKNTLVNDNLDENYRALFIALPTENDIALAVKTNVNPTAIHEVRKEFRKRIGEELYDDFTSLYKSLATTEPYKPDAKSVGKRSLRNISLAYLTMAGKPEADKTVFTQFNEATNMTDKAFALSLLSHMETPLRQQALDAFYAEWKDDQLVLSKWFTMQAISNLPNALDNIKELTNHPLFDLKNPNRARSVISAFANANPVNFNAEDGSGYEFIATKILEIDTFNNQIAARMLGAFESWKSLEPTRRTHAKNALENIKNNKGISVDVQEIVEKILG